MIELMIRLLAISIYKLQCYTSRSVSLSTLLPQITIMMRVSIKLQRNHHSHRYDCYRYLEKK